MDKQRIDKMALASGLEHKLLDNGTMGFRPYIYEFAGMVESAVAYEYEQKIESIVQIINDHWYMTDDSEATKGHVLNSILDNIKELREVKNAD